MDGFFEAVRELCTMSTSLLALHNVHAVKSSRWIELRRLPIIRCASRSADYMYCGDGDGAIPVPSEARLE